jgi:hypothetical protein
VQQLPQLFLRTRFSWFSFAHASLIAMVLAEIHRKQAQRISSQFLSPANLAVRGSGEELGTGTVFALRHLSASFYTLDAKNARRQHGSAEGDLEIKIEGGSYGRGDPKDVVPSFPENSAK